jgi:hypothetical protein
MVFASERFVHFLVDIPGRSPQRCRISLLALATLEGMCPDTAQLDQSTVLFLKHRRTIEKIALMKSAATAGPTRWVTVSVGDLRYRP